MAPDDVIFWFKHSGAKYPTEKVHMALVTKKKTLCGLSMKTSAAWIESSGLYGEQSYCTRCLNRFDALQEADDDQEHDL